MEWVPTSLCENPSISLPKESVPDLSDLVVMWEAIVFLSSIQTVFTGVSLVVPEYESSWMIISAQMRTRYRVVDFRHCVTVAFLYPFFCVRNSGETLLARWRVPLPWEILRRFLLKRIPPF